MTNEMRLSDIPLRIREAVQRKVLVYSDRDKQIKLTLLTTLSASGLYPFSPGGAVGMNPTLDNNGCSCADTFCGTLTNYAI